MKTLLSTVAVAAAIALTGCAPDKHITEVKALAFSYPRASAQDPNLTVDQALDYRKVCDSVKWKVDQTEQHQVFVQYRCDYKGVKDSAFAERDKADIVSEGDVYQWTYGSDGRPAFSYAGFVIRFKGGAVRNYSNVDTTHLMEMASDNKVTNADEAFSYLVNTPIPTRPALPITDITYGNTMMSLYPGRSAVDAAILTYRWILPDAEVSTNSPNKLGYPAIGAGCASATRCYVRSNKGDDRTSTMAYLASHLLPVDPKDVGVAIKFGDKSDGDYSNPTSPTPSKLICQGLLCYDSSGFLVGKAPASIVAKEVGTSVPVQEPSAPQAPAAAEISQPNNATDSLDAATPPPAPAPQEAQAIQPTPAAPVTPQVVNSAVAALTGATRPQGQPVANTTVHSGDVGPDGWPKMTPCIQKLQDKFTIDQQKQNADSSTSLEQMQEWADVCKSLGQ